MARFHDLPNEIVCEVLKVVLPADLESFAQTTRHVFLLSKPFLEEHRKLIRLYTTFSSHPPPGQERHTGPRDGFSVGPVPTLFRDMLNEPRIGHYIREAKIDTLLLGIRFHNTYHKNTNPEPRALYKQQHDLIDAAVTHSDVPAIRDKRERLKEAWPIFAYGGEDLQIALLLPLLPNLHSLSIEWDAGPGSYLLSMVRHGAFVGFPWLANLTTVLLGQRPWVRKSLCLSNLRLFNSLPALKSLTAFKVGDDPGYLDTMDKPLRRQDSHTTELKLLDSSVSSQSLHRCLKSFQGLQNFTFQYHPSQDPINDGDFDPFWIRKALLTCAKTNLRTLRLGGPRASDQFMGSLQEFEALRDIHTELSFLFPKNSDLETQPSRVLPASLHRLQLDGQSDSIGDEYQAFFRGIQRAKNEICLHLEEVKVKTKAGKYAWRQSWSAGGQGRL